MTEVACCRGVYSALVHAECNSDVLQESIAIKCRCDKHIQLIASPRLIVVVSTALRRQADLLQVHSRESVALYTGQPRTGTECSGRSTNRDEGV